METRRGLRHLFLFWITLILDFSPGFSDPLLYYIDKTNIRSHDLETGSTMLVLPSAFKNGVAMDFHYGTQKLYVADTVTRKLHSVTLNAASLEPGVDLLLSDLEVHGLAVDWINNNLYWTDTERKKIGVMNLKTTQWGIIIDTDLSQPRAIAVDPRDTEKRLYFTDGQGIYRAGLDGIGKETIIETDLMEPNGLSIDFSENKLCWTDSNLNRIECSSLSGKSRAVVLDGLAQPYSLVVHQGDIYWTELDVPSIKKMDKATMMIQEITTEDKPTAIQVYDSSRQPAGTAVCGLFNEGCSDVCLPSRRNRFTCACPSGMVLHTSGRKCIIDKTSIDKRWFGLGAIPVSVVLVIIIVLCYCKREKSDACRLCVGVASGVI